MDLQTIKTQRQRVATRLRELENNIQRVINLRNQNRQNEKLIHKYNTELSLCTEEQNEWQQYEQQLEEREAAIIQEESDRGWETGSSGGSGIAFGCGTILAGVGIFVFSRMVGFHLDFGGYMLLALIAVVSGLLTIVIAQFD
jgi:hypothetical protein